MNRDKVTADAPVKETKGDGPPFVISPDELDERRDLALRRGYLQIIDAIERRWGIHPTTAELRKQSAAQ